MKLNKIISIIKEARSIAILPHVLADGDALGSSLALAQALKKLGKDVVVYLEEDVPKVYNFLPDVKNCKVYDNKPEKADVAVALDTGDIERLGTRADIFHASGITVNIDHHNTNSEFGFYNFINTEASAVGEIIYEMLKVMGLSLDTDISVCLYVAIATDTGGFRYSNTTPATHKITAELINNGVNVSQTSQKIFDTTSVQKVKLTGIVVNSLELYENEKVAVITLTDSDMEKAGAKDEDCDGLVNLGRNIDSVEVSVMLRARNNGEIKVNLRSKDYVDVASIANFYKGGGHKRAAGCIISNKKLEEVKQLLLKDIKEALEGMNTVPKLF